MCSTGNYIEYCPVFFSICMTGNTSTVLNYLPFQPLDFEGTLCRLFQKRIVCTKLDTYGFYFYSNFKTNPSMVTIILIIISVPVLQRNIVVLSVFLLNQYWKIL